MDFKSIRTKEGKYKDIWLEGLRKEALKRKKHIYCGHYHKAINGEGFTALADAGVSGFFHRMLYRKKKTIVIADLHLGLEKTRKEAIRIIDYIKRNKYQIVIFLGDTFEGIVTDEKILENNGYFFNWLQETEAKVYFIKGNHDRSVLERDFGLNLLIMNNKAEILDELELGENLFIHSDKFDPNAKKFGFLYSWAFYIADWVNPAIGKLDKFLDFFGWKRGL